LKVLLYYLYISITTIKDAPSPRDDDRTRNQPATTPSQRTHLRKTEGSITSTRNQTSGRTYIFKMRTQMGNRPNKRWRTHGIHMRKMFTE